MWSLISWKDYCSVSHVYSVAIFSILLLLAHSQHLRRCGAMIGRRSWQHTETSSKRPSSEKAAELILLIQNSRDRYVCVFSLKNMNDSSIVVLLCYRLAARRIVVRFPAEARDCIPPPYPRPLKLLDRGSSLGDEALGREADHWTSYCAEFRNMWSCISTPLHSFFGLMLF
jgi:hypothetical protein